MASEHNFSINDGIHGDLPSIAPVQLAVICSFMALSLWIVLEFHVRVFRLFTRRRGLYFWSLLALAWGVVLHSVGYLLNWFVPECPWEVYALMNAIGWSMLVTAESLVLYSRLHLVTRNRAVHRFVLWMIVATALLIQVPNWCISIPAVSHDEAVSAVWSPRDSIETRIQQVAFLLQESTISGLYIFYAHRLLKPNSHVRERRVVWDLIFVSSFVIFLDVVVIILAFTNVHIIKEPLQNFSYALKLQLEFFVLNQLMAVSGEGFSSPLGGQGHRRNRYHAPKTPSDASKAPVLEKDSMGSTGSAQRMASNDTGASTSNMNKEMAPAGMFGSQSTGRTVVSPGAAHIRDQNGQFPASLPDFASPVSPLASSPVRNEEEMIIPTAVDTGNVNTLERGVAGYHAIGGPDVVAPLRVSSRNGPRAERMLPSPPSQREEPATARSWLDLEERLTYVERRLEAIG